MRRDVMGRIGKAMGWVLLVRERAGRVHRRGGVVGSVRVDGGGPAHGDELPVGL
jgi:hypothetical protein